MENKVVFGLYLILIGGLWSCSQSSEPIDQVSSGFEGQWSGSLIQDDTNVQLINLTFGKENNFIMSVFDGDAEATGIYSLFVNSQVLIFEVKQSNILSFAEGMTTFNYELRDGELLLSASQKKFLLKKTTTVVPRAGIEGDWTCNDRLGNQWYFSIGKQQYNLLVVEKNSPAVFVRGNIVGSSDGNQEPLRLTVSQAKPPVSFEYLLLPQLDSQKVSEPLAELSLIPYDVSQNVLDTISPVNCTFKT